jgi:hypothetical protein
MSEQVRCPDCGSRSAHYPECPQVAAQGTAMHVSWLADALDAITRYTTATGRLGMHDLSLLDTLRDREGKGALNCTAREAMLRLMERGETVFIGGPRGADLWQFFDEDVDETLKRVGVANPDYDEDGS